MQIRPPSTYGPEVLGGLLARPLSRVPFWRDRLARKVHSILQTADIRVNAPLDLGPAKPSLYVHDSRFFSEVLARGSLGLGESYVKGWWDCSDLAEFFTRVIRADLDRNDPSPWTWLYRLRLQLINPQYMGLKRRKVADQHYDLGNDFFQHMLDPEHMQYTCAYFSGTQDLDEAQRKKVDLIARKLHLRAGQKILELGGGFGGLAKHLASRYGVHVTLVNISKEQCRFADAQTRSLPQGRVDVLNMDFRDLAKTDLYWLAKPGGKFDRIVSVGMMEHVGPKNYRAMMKIAHRFLEPGGLFLLHTIGNNEGTNNPPDPWMEKYIFPHSQVPTKIQRDQAAAGLFVAADEHDFGPDYDLTCMAWFERFNQNWPAIRRLPAFQETLSKLKTAGINSPAEFYRMWKYYLMASVGQFRSGKGRLWQMVYARQEDGVPSWHATQR